jgi:hypothetical protein
MFFPLLLSRFSEYWSIFLVNMAAKWLEKHENPKFQSKSIKTVQFDKFFSAGRTGPVSSESRKNPAENRTVVTLDPSVNTESGIKIVSSIMLLSVENKKYLIITVCVFISGNPSPR